MVQFDSEWEQLLKWSQPKHFSDATVFDIMSRLPVKSILRFKSVCKKWLALFGGRQFIENHLNRSVEGSDCGYLVRHHDFVEEICSYELVFSLRRKENFEEMCKLHFEPEPEHEYAIVAATDGIVCMIQADFTCTYLPEHAKKTFYLSGMDMDILLWNPASRKSRILPMFPGRCLAGTCLGFGFDPKNNDYKVIAISERNYSLKVSVYSLRTDTWRVIEANYYNRLDHQEIFLIHVNGRMHYLAGTISHGLIVSFDVAEEKLIVMDMPEIEYSNDDSLALHESPASLGKSLILSIRRPREGCQTWLMKEYGVPKSWTKLYYFSVNPISRNLIAPFFFLDNGKIIMQGDARVLKCDSMNLVYKVLNFQYTPPAVKYKSSLVSVRGGSIA